MEVTMSEKSEKLVHIIMPDLLNYLEMVESGEIIEQRIKRQQSTYRKEKMEIDDNNLDDRNATK